MLSVYDQYTDIQIADIKTGLVIFSRDEAGIGADISEEEAIKNAGLAGVGEQIYFKKDQGKVALHILHPIAASTRAGEVGRPSLAAIFMVNPERLLKQLLHGDTGLGQSE
ncbi:MAG: hypothetical protein U1C55_00370, partial [Smithellaceae bacterium]|nr:hypothetical protein [Smithellaceae bacterium]